jgi:hypothetical protein
MLAAAAIFSILASHFVPEDMVGTAAAFALVIAVQK